LVLEIQQPVDLTYRLYDYGRKNAGRKLNVKEAIDSSNIPFVLDNQISFSNELHTPYFDIHIIENQKIKLYKFPSAK
jgi:mannose-6-phosphate isomerase class I